MNKYIIFDFDGVLCDSTSLAYELHNLISDKYNLPKIYSGVDYLNIIDNSAIDKHLSLDDKKKYYKEHRDLIYKNKSKLELFKQIIKLFSLNNDNFIIVSSTYEKTINEILIKNNIKLLYVYGRETEGRKIDKVNKVLDILNINKDDIIYIGDTLDDLKFCEKAEIDMFGSNYGYSNFDNVKSKCLKKVFKSPDEMVDYVFSNYKNK